MHVLPRHAGVGKEARELQDAVVLTEKRRTEVRRRGPGRVDRVRRPLRQRPQPPCHACRGAGDVLGQSGGFADRSRVRGDVVGRVVGIDHPLALLGGEDLVA